jgi:hypothetical protein
MRFRAEAAVILGVSPAADPNEEHAPDDDATLARLILQAEPTTAWARIWLGHSRTGLNHPAEQPAGAAMSNGPAAFARP